VCQYSTPATIAGLLEYLPADIRIIPHICRPGFSAWLGADDIVARIRRHRAELLHIATSGPAAVAALFAAARLELPVVGSFDLDALTETSLRRRYLRTLVRLCDKVLVSSSCARSAFCNIAEADKIGVWRPGVDIETFTPRKRSTALENAGRYRTAAWPSSMRARCLIGMVPTGCLRSSSRSGARTRCTG
jgi:hypothetical protein